MTFNWLSPRVCPFLFSQTKELIRLLVIVRLSLYNNMTILPTYGINLRAIYFQSETNHDILVDKPSIYRIILRYINLNNQAISGEISVSPESSNTADSEQKFEVNTRTYAYYFPRI